MKHVVLYVPGLGDTNTTGRRLLVAGWRLYGVTPVVHQMNWADKLPFTEKFDSLLQHIDTLVAAGNRVSLVGESAGASAAMNAYAARPDAIHRVVCICGKLRNPETISPHTYAHNPAFATSMEMLPGSLKALEEDQLQRVRSVHPLEDPTVPITDTIIPGTESKTILSVGHASSIVLSATLFSYVVLGFIKRR